MDRDTYAIMMQKTLMGENEHIDNKEIVKNLEIVEESVQTLHIQDGKCKGIVLKSGEILLSEAVILTTGTFLGAKVHIGHESRTGGRYLRFKDKTENADRVEPPSNEMARCIRGLGFPVDRLRTGTPPRLDYDSIDFSGMEV
jgi:tRNA uridine 5-carboxymethylaminomethyl modification enzyme